MNFRIQFYPEGYDPRLQMFSSSEEWGRVMIDATVKHTESQAADFVRERYPDAVGMPFTIRLGSGEKVLLGIVADPYAQIDPDQPLPFVALVEPLPEHALERQQCKPPRSPFSMATWKLPIHRPELFGDRVVVGLPCEVRSTEFGGAGGTRASVTFGSSGGRLVVLLQLGETEVSIRVDDPRSVIARWEEITNTDGEYFDLVPLAGPGEPTA